MEAYDEGVLTRILVAEGTSVPIGTPIAVIGEAVAEAAAPSLLPVPDDPERAVVPPGFLTLLRELIEQPLDIGL